MPSEFFSQRRVEFADTDTAGMLHFTMYARYAEEAEHAFFVELGQVPFVREPDGAFVGFPRLAVQSEFRKPAAFHDLLDIQQWVSKLSRRTLEISTLFTCGGQETARLKMTIAQCRGRPNGKLEILPVPELLRARLEVSARPPLEFR